MKAVITDLDNTLLRADKTISEYTLSILTKCQEAGIPILAATARPERSIARYHGQVGFQAMTTLNGAKVTLPAGVVENGITSASARSILQRAVAISGAVISLETDAGFFSNLHNPEWNPIIFDQFPDLPPCGQIYKILLSCPTADLRQVMDGFLPDDTYFSIAEGTLMQVMDRRATKWNGVKAMLGAMGIAPEDAVYFGDDNDDIEPIRKCGVGVAVSNAIGAVLAAADHVTASNDLDGVARWLETHL